LRALQAVRGGRIPDLALALALANAWRRLLGDGPLATSRPESRAQRPNTDPDRRRPEWDNPKYRHSVAIMRRKDGKFALHYVK